MRLPALVLAAGVCVFYLLTLRPGQGWMDDYAQYVLHGVNIAEGRPYADTGYIFNPSYQVTGPVTYPPVFPLLLAPVYKVAGMNLQAMKAVTVIAFSFFLYILFLIFRERLGPGRALLVSGLVGFSPLFWKFKDYLYSEYPFLLFSFAAIYVYGRARACEAGRSGWLPRALGAGLLLYLAYGTRSAGALLLPVFMLADLAEGRKVSRTFLAAAATALCLAAAQTLTLHSDAVYAEQVRYLLSHATLPAAFLNNLLAYPERFAQLFGNGYSPALALVLLACTAALGAVGFAAVLKRKISALESYAAVHLLFILFCPVADGLRYAFPLVPFLFYYALLGWRELSMKLGRPARYAGPGLLLLVLLSYAGAYAKADHGGFREGTGKDGTKRLFEYVSRRTPSESVFVFRKPRTLTLYTGRRAAMYHFGEDAELLAFFQEAGAGFLVTGGIFPEDRAFLIPFVARNRDRFTEVYSNSDFTVYKIN